VEAYKGTLEVFEATQAAHYLGITKANLQFAEHLLHKRRD
jgi:hypothetical protein